MRSVKVAFCARWALFVKALLIAWRFSFIIVCLWVSLFTDCLIVGLSVCLLNCFCVFKFAFYCFSVNLFAFSNFYRFVCLFVWKLLSAYISCMYKKLYYHSDCILQFNFMSLAALTLKRLFLIIVYICTREPWLEPNNQG